MVAKTALDVTKTVIKTLDKHNKEREEKLILSGSARTTTASKTGAGVVVAKKAFTFAKDLVNDSKRSREGFHADRRDYEQSFHNPDVFSSDQYHRSVMYGDHGLIPAQAHNQSSFMIDNITSVASNQVASHGSHSSQPNAINLALSIHNKGILRVPTLMPRYAVYLY